MVFEIVRVELLNERLGQRAGESGAAAIDGGGDESSTRMIAARPCLLPFGEELRPAGQILTDTVILSAAYGIGEPRVPVQLVLPRERIRRH